MGGLLGSVTVGANKQTDLKRISIKSCRSCYDELIVCSVEGKYVRFNKRKNPIEFIKKFRYQQSQWVPGGLSRVVFEVFLL